MRRASSPSIARPAPHPSPAPNETSARCLLLSLRLALAARPALPSSTAADACEPCRCVRADHDHMHRPFVWLTTDEADLGGQLSLGRMPRSYQVAPKVLGRRRATQPMPVRPAGRQAVTESARRQPENQPHGSDVTARRSKTLTVTAVTPLLLRRRLSSRPVRPCDTARPRPRPSGYRPSGTSCV